MYNIMFPVWLLFLFPITWLLVIPVNFAFDSLILFMGMLCVHIEDKLLFYKKTIIWVFLFGFIADILGGILLLLTQFLGEDGFFYEYITAPIAQNPFDNIYSLIYTVIAVIVSGGLIYIFNRFISFHKCQNKRIKRVISLILAFFTAPYFFLIPTAGVYGGQTESFTNHIVWDTYINAEFYLAEDPETDILSVNNGEHYNYVLVSSLRDGINTADKTEKKDLGDWDYRVVFYKSGVNSNKLEDIFIYKKGGNLYFVWKDTVYIISQSCKEEIIKEIDEVLNAPNDDEEAV